MGYLETSSATGNRLHTETAHLFKTLLHNGAAVGSFVLGQEQDVWDAIRGFFRQQVAEQE